MPYFHYDLVIGTEFRDQGGMILEDQDLAKQRADSLASEMAIIQPDLKAMGCSIRVLDDDNREIYRSPLDPIPSWRHLQNT